MSYEVDTLTFKNSQVRISRLGATVLSWQVGEDQLIDGYRDEVELRDLDGMRSALLAPWSNRVEDARYSWNGKDYDLGPAADGSREALHGLVYKERWELVDRTENRVTYRYAVAARESYPWRIGVEVAYCLDHNRDDNSRLSLHLVAKNESDTDAPVGLGWHPYFTMGPVDECSVYIPAATRIEDVKCIPVPGEKAFVPNTQFPSPIGDLKLDVGFTELTDDPAVIAGPLGEIRIRGNQKSDTCGVGTWHLYTGDAAKVRTRTSIAIEPCTFMTNMINRPALAQNLALAPKDQRVLNVSCLFIPAN